MAELTFKSPGVSTREIDLSGPTQSGPSGIPAGVIGTAKQGRAFVPITMATFADFVAEFGDVETDLFAPMAMRQWLGYANAGTFVRTLGAGDGKKRATTGIVTNGGFVVGAQGIQTNGAFGNNSYAGTNVAAGTAATIALTSTTANFANGDRFSIRVPASIGGQFIPGSGTVVQILFADGARSSSANIIEIRRDASGETATALDLAQLLVDAINGTAPSGAQPGGSGTFASTDIRFSSTDIGKAGVPGVTASRVGAAVTITSSQLTSVGNQIVLTDTNNDPIAASTGASPASPTGGLDPHGGLGKTHFLSVIMTEANSSGLLSEAGLLAAQPLLRGVILAPSGVNLALSASRLDVTNNLPLGAPGAENRSSANRFGTTTLTDGGSSLGAVNIGQGRQEFVMLQNGHTHTDSYPTIVTASFDPNAPNYFATVFNTDPTKTEQAGHCLYAHWDVSDKFAVPSGSSAMAAVYAASSSVKEGKTVKNEDIAFLLTSSAGRATGTATKPDYESFSDRFRTAKYPTVISQEFGGTNLNLFTVHCLDDGAIGNTRTKISIENIIKSTNTNNKYGTFDLLVRDYTDTDAEPKVLERFVKLSLDPNNERYITRVIGDYNIFYDFDKRAGGQKLVVEGSYPNASNYIRIAPSTQLERGNVPSTSLPVGFRGIQHLITSGSSIFGDPTQMDLVSPLNSGEVASQTVTPPIPMRRTVAQGVAPRKRINTSLYWGVQSEKQASVAQPNGTTARDTSLESFGTYFPNYHRTQRPVMVDGLVGTADSSGTILDSDRFNNNKFSLEKIQVITTTADKADAAQWAAATYRRNGTATATLSDIDGTSSSSTRLLNVEKDFTLSTARPFLKFTMIAQGGFDGLDVFNAERVKMTSPAVRREMTFENQGLTSGPTVAAYRKALDVMSERSDVDIQLLAIPGIRHSGVTDYAIQTVEERFDALYIMDLETNDVLGNIVSGSNQDVSVINTASTFNARNLDSSFAAAYFPDVIMQDPISGAASSAPPSVAVLGAFGLNDSVAFPWYAPAGFTRGALKNVLETQVKLNRENLDTLYEADINPITSFPQTKEVVVFGQKTLLAAQSALDRVNVRRLLIDIRRQVRKIGDTFLFEPNRESTLARFSAAVTPVLTKIQAQQGLERFKVQIDTTTTTQADVENNTVRGKIFLQPVRSVEFISLDFVVTNAGLDI